MALFDEEKFGHVRTGQLPLFSYEYLIDENPDLTPKENFQLRKDASDIYCLGGRLFGKTLCVEKLDLLISMIHNNREKCGFSSYNLIHIKLPLEDVIWGLDNHPFYRIFDPHINRHPNYRIVLKNGYLLEGINMNLTGKRPGEQFFGKHLSRLYIEEASFETEEVYNNREHSVSEFGCIFRVSGMTSFTKHSPCGRLFYDKSLKSWFLNLPQYINPNWGKEEKERAIKKFGGEQTVSYRVFVRGEIVGEAVCVDEDSRVLMSDFSTKKIKDVNIGDELLAFEENSVGQGIARRLIKSKVLEKIDNGIRDVVHIKSNDNELFLTPTHRVLSKRKSSRKSCKWCEIEKCLKRNYFVSSLENIVYNEKEYFWGVFLGIVESDGNKFYGKRNYSITITQSLSTEWRSFEWVFNYLGLKYKKYFVKSNNPKYKGMYRYIIRPIRNKDNKKINYYYNLLTKNKNVDIGFIVGFILGDGSVTKNNLSICQSYIKNKDKCLLLEKLFSIYKIKYNKQISNENKATYNLSVFSILPFCPLSYKSKKFEKVILNKILIGLNKNVREIERSKKRVYDLITTSKTFIVNGFFIHNSTFDMDLINYLEDKRVKIFEINKDNFEEFENIIIIEKPTNASNCFIAADVGEDAPTEIGIFFEINKKYRYVYNITAYNLTDEQQKKLFRWIAEQINANYIAPDSTEQLGRAIYRDLEKTYGKEHLTWVSFNEKIAIDYKRDENGRIIYKKGKPIPVEEHVFAWSVKKLKDLLYDGKLQIPLDHKFDTQISSVVTLVSGNKTTYHCNRTDDHLFQMFQVLAIMIWDRVFSATKAIQKREYFKGIV